MSPLFETVRSWRRKFLASGSPRNRALARRSFAWGSVWVRVPGLTLALALGSRPLGPAMTRAAPFEILERNSSDFRGICRELSAIESRSLWRRVIRLARPEFRD